jgi:hypothetical protein
MRFWTLALEELDWTETAKEMIAQKRITERHVLRVIYRQEEENQRGDHILSRTEGAL